MKARQYAEALYLATVGKNDTDLERIVQNVRALLLARGHTRLLPAIVRELERLDHLRRTSDTLQVRVARREDLERHTVSLEKDVARLDASTLSREVVCDSAVIGGYEVRARGVRIDRTYKRALVELYGTLVAR